MNFKILNDIISTEEQLKIIELIHQFKVNPTLDNVHIKEIAEHLKGFSVLHDMTNTEPAKAVSTFQSNNNLLLKIDSIFYDIKDRIANTLNINADHVFFQGIYMKEHGEVKPHYDAAYPGFITYKCNVNVKSLPYNVHVDKTILSIKERDLYCFEASLYKHWVDPCKDERILLSYGFLLPYKDLSFSEDDPRVRLSNRIQSKFQQEKLFIKKQ